MVELKKTTILSWRKFLSTEAGQEGMLYLRERVPSVNDGEAHSIILQAGVVKGYNRALDTIPEVLGKVDDAQNMSELENK